MRPLTLLRARRYWWPAVITRAIAALVAALAWFSGSLIYAAFLNTLAAVLVGWTVICRAMVRTTETQRELIDDHRAHIEADHAHIRRLQSHRDRERVWLN